MDGRWKVIGKYGTISAKTFLSGTFYIFISQLLIQFQFLSFSAPLKHVVRDLVYDRFNRGYVLQVLKPFKSKFVVKSYVPLTKVFTETVTYVKVERKIDESIKMTS